MAARTIVLGRDEQGKPQAARFPAGHHGLVAKAAKAMNLAVCKADGEVLAELAKKLPLGRLGLTGRGFVLSAAKPLRQARRAIEAGLVSWCQARPSSRRPARSNADQPARLASHLGRHCGRPPGDRPGRGNGTGGGRPSSSPATATMPTLKWPDYPWQPNVVRHAGSVALLKPGPVST